MNQQFRNFFKKKDNKIILTTLTICIALICLTFLYNEKFAFFVHKKLIENDIKNGNYIKPNTSQINNLKYYYKMIDAELIKKAIKDVQNNQYKYDLIDTAAYEQRKDMLPIFNSFFKQENNVSSPIKKKFITHVISAEESIKRYYQPEDIYDYRRDYLKRIMERGKNVTDKPGELDLDALRKIAQEVLQELKTKGKSKFNTPPPKKENPNN